MSCVCCRSFLRAFCPSLRWMMCALAVMLLLSPEAHAQESIWTEPFDDRSQFTVTEGAIGQDGDENYFLLAQSADPSINKTYSGQSGNFLTGQDTNDSDIAPGAAAPVQVTWTNIDISGEGGLQFSGDFGSVSDGTEIEDSDFVRVEYRIGDGPWQPVIAFRNGSGDTGTFQEDTDFDGVGEGAALSSTLSSFTKEISGIGSTLDLRFEAHVDANEEDVAVDAFEIASTSSVQLSASSGLVREDDGATALAVQLSDPGSAPIDVTVSFDDNASTATQADFTSAFPGTNTSTTVSFSGSAPDGATKTIPLSLATGDGAESVEDAQFSLSSNDVPVGDPSQFALTIRDGVSDHAGDVLITELMPNPEAVGDTYGEYVELFNTTAQPIDLSGWTLDGEPITDVVIPARGFALLCRNGDPSSNGGLLRCDDGVDMSLANGSDTVVLSDGTGTVDQVNYDDTNWPDPAGASMVFTGTSDNNTGSQWAEATRREQGFALNQSYADTGSPGRNGHQQTLQPSTEITGAAGWRMLSAPVSGVNADTLAQMNLVQGLLGHFPGASPNLYRWTGSSNADWGVPAPTTDLTSGGRGFIWYLYDNVKTDFTDPPPFTLSVPGALRTSSVTASSLDGNRTFHLLGNPYAQSFDLSALNLTENDFCTTVQVWDPSLGTSGGYEDITQTESADDLVGPYQGFFAERCTGSSTQLTFDPAGRRPDPAPLQDNPEAPPRVEFRLVGWSAGGTALTVDQALTLHAPAGATPAWDVHDATKLTPLSGHYATAAFQGMRNGERRLKAVASIPPSLPDGGMTVPLSLNTQGTDSVTTFTLSWPTWEHVPRHWSITLHDAATDSTVDLRAQSSYAFSPSATNTQSQPPRSPLQPPERLRSTAPGDSTRFELRLQTDPLPVELAHFHATHTGNDVRLAWTTASETNNAGFYVEHRAPNASTFASLGFVKGHGTTQTTQRYQFRTDPLHSGQHTFRLRQVDADGSTHYSDTTAVEVRLSRTATVSLAPNPVRTRANITVRVGSAQPVTVALYDLLGRRVRTLYDNRVTAHRPHTLPLHVEGLSSGPYLLRVEGDHFQKTRRVTVIQ